MIKATSFTVNRNNWLRKDENSMLLRPSDGKMCCMGFYALACGATREEIEGKSALNDIDGAVYSEWSTLCDEVAGEYNNLYTVNDETGDEEKITAWLAERGITVTFTDGDENV